MVLFMNDPITQNHFEVFYYDHNDSEIEVLRLNTLSAYTESNKDYRSIVINLLLTPEVLETLENRYDISYVSLKIYRNDVSKSYNYDFINHKSYIGFNFNSYCNDKATVKFTIINNL